MDSLVPFPPALWVCKIDKNRCFVSQVQLFLENESNDSSDNLSPALVDQVGSLQGYTVSGALHLVYTWIGVFVFDICVFSLTLWKTWRMRRDRIPGGIGSIMMRDGLMYFVAIALINLVNILVFALGGVCSLRCILTLQQVQTANVRP
jgi:hypothetical protein